MSIPAGTKFIGIAADVDTYERKSAQANSPSNVYTIEDIQDGSVPDTRTITINGSTQDLSANRTYNVTDANLSTSDITTNNVSITKHGFAPKAPNDTSKFLSGDGTWRTIDTGITVGTTPVTSGTDGRVFFQAGGVVQQSANLFWDNTNNALGLGASPLSTSRLDIRAIDGLITSQSLRIGRSTDNATQFEVNGQGLTTIRTNGGGGANSLSIFNSSAVENFRVQENGVLRFRSLYPFDNNSQTTILAPNNVTNSLIINSLSVYDTPNTNRNLVGFTPTFQHSSGTNSGNILNIIPTINTNGGTNTIRGIYYNPTLTSLTGTTHRAIETTTGDVIFNSTSGNVAIGTTSPGARLDVRAQGALSTDIAFRVRNSADTADLFKIRGNASTIFGGTGADYLSIIGGSNWGTDCYFDFSGGNYIRFLGQSGDISIFTNSSLRSRGTYIGGATQLVYFDNGGNIRIGQGHSNVNQPDVNATRTIQQMTGVAPTTSVADGFQQYSADVVAGNAAPHFRTENGAIVKVYQETTGVGASTLVGGGGTTLTDTDTFDGYTLKQIVKALRNQGLLA